MIRETNDRFRLTNRERDILDILWDSEKSMVASEITAAKDDLSINTVQAVLKKLLQKDLIKVDEIVYSGTVLSRSYKPTLAPEQFEIQRFEAAYSRVTGKPFELSAVVDAMLDEEDIENRKHVIAQLEDMLAKKREVFSVLK